jgi:hypothetical protein
MLAAHLFEGGRMTDVRVAGVLGGSEEDWAEWDRDHEELYTDEFQAKYRKPVEGEILLARVREELADDKGTEFPNKAKHAGKPCLICYKLIPEDARVIAYRRKRIFPFYTTIGRMCPEHKR